jgi:lipoprotein LpqH
VAKGLSGFAAIGTALVAGGLVACSPQAHMAVSTASVNINGIDAIKTDHVQCTQIQWLKMVDIGDNMAGARLFVDETGATPDVESVHIRNLGGFSGMYSQGDGGNGDTTFTQARLTVTGTADGFNTDDPDEPATAAYRILVRC